MILFQKITDILQITDKLIYKFILLDKAWTPRFCAGSKPTRVPEICDSKTVVLPGNKTNRASFVNNSA